MTAVATDALRHPHAPGGRHSSLKGTAQHFYEMENLIKLHKARLASDRMSCHRATANQVRLALHTAAFWLMHCVRSAIPQTSPLARCEFATWAHRLMATLRERLIKIGARVIEHIARILVQLPTSCPEGGLFRAVALGLMPSGPRDMGPRAPTSRRRGRSIPNALHSELSTPIQGTDRRHACAGPASKNARRDA